MDYCYFIISISLLLILLMERIPRDEITRASVSSNFAALYLQWVSS